MTPAETRAAGVLYAKAAECFLGMAQAEEQGDHARYVELANDVVKVMIAMVQITAVMGNAPTPELEDAWRTMGAMSGWKQDPDEEEEEHKPDELDALMTAARVYRDVARLSAEPPAGPVLDGLREAAIVYGKSACGICLWPVECGDPKCLADSHTHEECCARVQEKSNGS